jgi:hypothetical protein
LAKVAIGWPFIAPDDSIVATSQVFGYGGFGEFTKWGWEVVAKPVVPFTIVCPVTEVINEIRQTANFSSGNRINLWIEAVTPYANLTIDRAVTGSLTGSRLTIVQGGVTVYDAPLTMSLDDGRETVGGSWNPANTMYVINYGDDTSGVNTGDIVIGLSFPNATVNPSIPIDSATLTMYTDYDRISVGGTFRVYGQSQAAAPSAQWSASNKPVGNSAVKVASYASFVTIADPSKQSVTNTLYNVGMLKGAENYRSNDNYLESPGVIGYEYPFPVTPGGVSIGWYPITTADNERSALLGSAEFYGNQVELLKYYGCPFLPVGRIGLSASQAFGGSMPVVETEAVARAIIDQATAAMLAHSRDAARQKRMAFHASEALMGIGHSDATMYFYHLCKNVWGMSGAYYAYGNTSANTPVAESYAPIASSPYSDATLGSVDEDLYFMLGSWYNNSSPTVYNPPYSTAWRALPGAGCIMGPSSGWQYGLQMLMDGGACVLTDYVHITTESVLAHHGVFWNLLRGMTWLEASFYSSTEGNVPTGDPLWAPFGLVDGPGAPPTGYDYLLLGAGPDRLLISGTDKLRIS